MICVIVTYIVKPGHEEEAIELLHNMVQPTRAEPGNLAYAAHRSLTKPNQLMLYEQYTDRAAFDAHRATPHFTQNIVDGLWNIVESRTAEFYEFLG